MFISDIKRPRTYMAKVAFGYLAAALFLGVFSLIYEYYSFGVYSNYMVFAYLIPLAGGALPALVLSLFAHRPFPGWLPSELYRTGIATLAVGSVFRGVLDIYGTTSRWMIVYAVAGIALVLAAAGMYMTALGKRETAF